MTINSMVLDLLRSHFADSPQGFIQTPRAPIG
jgi:hypothetical protein